MSDFPFEINDEVFNKVTRSVGLCINIKNIDDRQYLRIHIEGKPDQVWPGTECELWHKKK